MTTQPVVECEHPEEQWAWLSGCCGAGYIYELSSTATGLCAKCRDWAGFELVCDCGATVEATGEAA